MKKAIRIFILEDMKSFVNGFQMCVRHLEDIAFMGSAYTVEDALKKVKNKPLDLILIDIKIGKKDEAGFKAVCQMKDLLENSSQSPAFVFLSGYDREDYIQKARDLNCSFLHKHLEMSDIIAALRTIHASGRTIILREQSEEHKQEKKVQNSVVEQLRTLTPRQAQIGANLCIHWTNERVAKALNISKSSVETHLKACYLRLGLNKDSDNREKLKQMFRESGLAEDIAKINQDYKTWFRTHLQS